MQNSNQKWYQIPEVIITLISTVCIMLTTIFTPIFTNEKDIREVFINTPNLDKINFLDYFGIKKNKIFTYEIIEKSIDDGAEYDSLYVVDVRVINIQTKDNISLVEFDNDILFPRKQKQKFYLLFISNMVYGIPQEQQIRVTEMFSKGNYKLRDSDFNVFPDYNLPFFHKQIFSSTIPHSLRGDKLYINHVQFEGTTNYFDGKKMTERMIYRIYNQTLSDQVYSEFIPYIGFTKHSYHHNGPRIEYNIELKNTEN
ncbi:hypothetical protein H3Z85_04435 [Chryseobacterium indologenes]|uniref:hypothetical protein n=1 Tax=Chryseobacterium indologenes TaxID=253 RepID=UPI0003E08621|nr:hypothetical protein [Chryseobacterium indologenes]QPQ52696.1 hypothetical protein H3Z85_04435 [Chryseobacterium indologenes]GAE65408.1 hypothetical protein CIN01S_11_00440 [Chryseobacterium indologenes NBRC 14944]SFK12929.1 hypothetical protein SAMN05421692_3466 [Chryseobacterium indologenes]SUX51410.1 Uncharacterised protein [Chryseobacterium indologenes]